MLNSPQLLNGFYQGMKSEVFFLCNFIVVKYFIIKLCGGSRS